MSRARARPGACWRLLAMLALAAGALQAALAAGTASAPAPVPTASATPITTPTASTSSAIELRDDRGVVIRLAAPARRIVSLLPSLTETVCALGACARLVGTDRWSNYPASVLGLPKLGGLEDAQVEAIVALKPDVVLLAGSTRALDRLQGLGLTVVALEPRSLADVKRVLDQVAMLVGSADADALWQRSQQQIERAAARLDPAARGLTAYHEVGSGPYAAGASSFTGELLARVGLNNIVPASLGPYPKLNPEFIVRADPAIILVSQRAAHELVARPGWVRIRALREQRICRFDPSAGDLLARPGPRLGDTAALLVDCINAAMASPRRSSPP